MIKLYTLSSPNVMKVAIMLEEVKLPYELVHVDIWAHEQFEPEFVALNPNSKVPVIVDLDGPDGIPITLFESGAILYYLATKVGRFLPKDPREHFITMQWLIFQMASVGPMFGQSNHFRLSAPPGNDYSVNRYVTETKRLFEVLEQRLSQSEYLGSEQYSIADMATYPWARYFDQNGIDLNTLPSVKRWMEDLEAREAVKVVLTYWPDLVERNKVNRAAATEDKLDKVYGRGRHGRSRSA